MLELNQKEIEVVSGGIGVKTIVGAAIVIVASVFLSTRYPLFLEHCFSYIDDKCRRRERRKLARYYE